MLNLDERLRQKIGRSSRTESMAIRFTEEEAAQLKQAAREQNTTVREWARNTLLTATRKSADDPLFVELIATRNLILNVLKAVAYGVAFTPEDFDYAASEVQRKKRSTTRQIKQEYENRTVGKEV